jgi:hypothetical protein
MPTANPQPLAGLAPTGYITGAEDQNAAVTLLRQPADAARVWWRAVRVPQRAKNLLVLGGGAPEEILFNDRFMQLVGVAWLVMFVLGIR